jgi:hypothetical protein
VEGGAHRLVVADVQREVGIVCMLDRRYAAGESDNLCAKKWVAIALPMPRRAPVTTATLLS